MLSAPPPVPKMSVNPGAESVVLQFIEQYFKLYDSDDRSQLLDAYHAEAVMSMNMEYPNQQMRYTKSLDKYRMDSRNLCR